MDLLDLLHSHPAAYLALSLVLGLLLGSFLNVVILRLPEMLRRDWAAQCAELEGREPEPDPEPLSLVHPPSRCPACGHRIRPWENVPVLSWLLLRGRCSACGTAIAWRYPVVELLTGLLTLAVAWRFGVSGQALAAMLLTWSLLALTVIDLDHQLLPDQITLPALWLGLLVNLDGLFADLPTAVLGAALGYLSLWLVFQLFRLLTAKEGMGYGDFKLFALFGAWLGWPLLPQIILVASVLGAVIGVALVLIRGRDRNLPIPFGPYLALGGWIALLWGADINRAYLQFAGIG